MYTALKEYVYILEIFPILKMKTQSILTLVVLIALFALLVGCGTEKEKVVSPQKMPLLPPAPVQSDNRVAKNGDSVTIEMRNDGFFPKSLSVSAGANVLFVNKGNKAVWPASDNHPTHTLYPGSSIRKCTSGEIIFDACQGIPPGGAWSFRFSEKGSWGYHDHISPGMRGVVLVE